MSTNDPLSSNPPRCICTRVEGLHSPPCPLFYEDRGELPPSNPMRYYIRQSGALIEVHHPEYCSMPVYVDYDQHLKEIERMTAETRRWQANADRVAAVHQTVKAERDRLRDELAAAKAACVKAHEFHGEKNTALVAERDRLRAALDKITRFQSDGELATPHANGCYCGLCCARYVAKEALAGDRPKDRPADDR